MMTRCAACNQSTDYYEIWQPFGPSESIWARSFAGEHYRGFPAIKICDDCSAQVERHIPTKFTYKKQTYLAYGSTVEAQS